MKNDHQIKMLLKSIVEDSETLKLLKSSPEKLATKTGLSKADVEALKGAEIVIKLSRRNIIFETGMTITAR
jgi:hypothetical protein